MNQNTSNDNQVDAPSTMDLDDFSEDDIALAMALSASIQSAAETMPPFATVNHDNETGTPPTVCPNQLLVSDTARTSTNNPSHTQASTDGSQTNEIRLPMNQNSDNNNQVDTASAVASDTFSEEDIALAMALSISIQSVEETITSYTPANLINEEETSTDGSQSNEIRLPMNPNSDNNNQVDTASTVASDTFSEEDIASAMALGVSVQSVEETLPSYAPANLTNEAANENLLPGNQNRDISDQVDTPSTMAINTYSVEYIESAAEVAALNASIHDAVESNTSVTTSLITQTGTSSVSPGPTQSRTRDNNNQVDTPSTEAIDTESLEEIELAMAIRFSIESAADLLSSNAIANLIVEAAMQDGDTSRSSSLCVICLDAPVEGACVPCGHMASCMSCLNEIKANNLGCPLCRAKIDQVIRIYAA